MHARLEEAKKLLHLRRALQWLVRGPVTADGMVLAPTRRALDSQWDGAGYIWERVKDARKP